MKTGKEYPATHSMSTAWYVVDDEGNVGIMDYNENGPVPNGLTEYGVGELVWGLCNDSEENKEIPIKLTTQQIYENLMGEHSPNDEDLWFDCIVKIKPTLSDRFLQLCENADIEEYICISKEEGIYIFDAFNCTDNENNNCGVVLQGSSLEKMLEEKIIESVFRYNEFNNKDTFNSSTNKPEHTKEYDSCAFFIFHQPYWEEFLPKKMSSPQFPVKLSQLPDDIRRKVHLIPGKFSELDTFQIAEYYPSNTTHSLADPVVLIDGSEYNVLPLPDGTEAYLLADNSENSKMKYTKEEFEELRRQGRVEIKHRK